MATTATISITKRTKRDRFVTQQESIPARWAGVNLAVHRPHSDLDGRGVWVVTHTASGLSVGGVLPCSMKRAVAFARAWDRAFTGVTKENVRDWGLRAELNADLDRLRLGAVALGPQR